MKTCFLSPKHILSSIIGPSAPCSQRSKGNDISSCSNGFYVHRGLRATRSGMVGFRSSTHHPQT